jgi:RNA-directed DNA polymerase
MPTDLLTAFEILFSDEQLYGEFELKHSQSASRGLDRRNGPAFEPTAEAELAVASRKCLQGRYSFTPYLETLKIKDHLSPPRRIGIPAIRDRVVLAQLNKLLRLAFPDESKSPLASTYVRKLAKELANIDVPNAWTAGCDIKKFYDSLDRLRMIKLLQERIRVPAALALIQQAINTPIVSQNYKKSDAPSPETRGVPQGLAISNALAAIYLHQVDSELRKMPVSYYRFVDDVLLIGGREETKKAQRSFAARVRARGLSVHTLGHKKSHHLPIVAPFNYLGYSFHMPKVTVRESTVENLIRSLAAKVTDYKHNGQRVIERRSYLTPEMYRRVFLDELNERISGAISDGRKYGWVAYFSEINDLTVLHRIDGIVSSLLARVVGLREHSGRTKRFARAYFEMRHRPYGGYVRNYDVIDTPERMIKFLAFRGRVGPGEQLTEEQIRSRFEAYRDRQLGLMLADEVQTY